MLSPLLVHEAVQHLLLDLVAQINLALEQPRDRLDDLLAGLLLHQVAHGAGPERTLGVETLVMHRDNQYGQVRRLHLDVLRELDAVRRLQRDVHDREIGLELAHELDRVGGVVRLADDLEVRLLVDQRLHALAGDGMIVDEQHLELRRHGRRLGLEHRGVG